MGFADLKNTIRNLVTSAVADSVVDHVASREREPIISENPPVVSGWRMHRTAGEPTWSAPPWATEGPREYARTMGAIVFALRHQKTEFEQAVTDRRKTGEPYEFTSRVLPADLQSLPRSVAANARALLAEQGWGR